MGSFRVEKMASFLRSLVSEAIAGQINDPRVSRFASVTRVEVSGDLVRAKVYVSVLGTPEQERTTMAGLQNASGYVQRWVARQLNVRSVPEIRFVLDESIKGAAETLRVINDAMREAGEPTGNPEDGEPESPAQGTGL
jgi:ribosome-binding factor A